MHTALLANRKAHLEGNSCIFYIFTILLLTFLSFCFGLSLTFFNNVPSTEIPVGYALGSKVRIREPVYDVPVGVLAIVQLIRPAHVHIHFINYGPREVASVRPDQIEDYVPVPHQNSPSKNDIDPEWPYWERVKQDPWYTENLCDGYLFCENHHCIASHNAFQRIAASLNQPYHFAIFPFRNVSSYTVLRAGLLQYMRILTSQNASRLYFINVQRQHAFLIEQNKDQFRIYQSWKRGFSLQYWTDPETHPDDMCEPGVTVSQILLDPQHRAGLLAMGISDDRERIKLSRSNYGCLQSLTRENMIRLIFQLSAGYRIMERKLSGGNQAILPADRVLRNVNSNQFLGKSAIKLSVMTRQDYQFGIEVDFIEFLH